MVCDRTPLGNVYQLSVGHNRIPPHRAIIRTKSIY
jgi:hypothetical protein